MSDLTDRVADHVWRWMNVCRERGATHLEAEILSQRIGVGRRHSTVRRATVKRATGGIDSYRAIAATTIPGADVAGAGPAQNGNQPHDCQP